MAETSEASRKLKREEGCAGEIQVGKSGSCSAEKAYLAQVHLNYIKIKTKGKGLILLQKIMAPSVKPGVVFPCACSSRGTAWRREPFGAGGGCARSCFPALGRGARSALDLSPHGLQVLARPLGLFLDVPRDGFGKTLPASEQSLLCAAFTCKSQA